jgi:hypothetical protein
VANPSEVEGPSHFSRKFAAGDWSHVSQSQLTGLSQQYLSVRWTRAFKQPRSFDSGSASFFGKTRFPLASAQDDGVLVQKSSFFSR